MNKFCALLHSSSLRKIVIFLGLCLYLVAGFYTELRLVEIKPLPEWLFEDFKYYERALQVALQGKDSYADRSIGTAFLYPPPALILVELFGRIQPFMLQVGLYSVVNLVLLALMVYGVARIYGYSLNEVWYWYVLCFGFAPFLELLHIGQINMLTLFGVFLMFYGELSMPLLAGGGLGLAIVTKVTPALFLAYLAANRRSKVIAATLAAVLLLSIFAFVRYGARPFYSYPNAFADLLGKFPLGPNSQSLVAKLSVGEEPWFQGALTDWPAFIQTPIRSIFAFLGAHPVAVQRSLTVYLLLTMLASGIVIWFTRGPREPFFIVVSLGMMLAPNILWYHHYVFLLLPLLIWMGWSRLDRRVVLWCFLGLLIVQVERRFPPYGLFIHIWAHFSLLGLLFWQILRFSRQRKPTPAFA